MATLKEVFRQMAQDGQAEFRETQKGEEQLLFSDKGILVGNGKEAIAIYKTNMAQFADWACVEEKNLFRLQRVTRKKISADEVDSFFEQPAAPAAKKTRKGS